MNDAVFRVTDRLAVLVELTLRLVAERPIHDWFAVAVSATAVVDAVLS